MNRFVVAACFAVLTCSSALAQKATATGTGVGIANSNSQSGAVAISGQGGQGGNSSLTINNPENTTSTSTATVNQTVSGTTTSNINSRVSGSTTVKSAPSMVAPGLTAAGLETCLGSASGTVSAVGFGIGGGSTYKDEDCTARLDSRTLFAMGLKAAAVARLCQRPDIWRSMPDVCERYWPPGAPLPYGIVVAAPTVVMSANPTGGAIEVIEGKTGLTRLCDNYDAARQRCRAWSGGKQRMATASHHKRPKPSAPASAAASSPAVQAIEAATAPKKED